MWRVQLSKDTRGPRKYIGYYEDEVEAAHAFDVAGT
jgi:non-ribosomal peptide synthetase component E (peptide arylation enzyme)